MWIISTIWARRVWVGRIVGGVWSCFGIYAVGEGIVECVVVVVVDGGTREGAAAAASPGRGDDGDDDSHLLLLLLLSLVTPSSLPAISISKTRENSLVF